MRRGRFAGLAMFVVAFVAVAISTADAGNGVVKSFGTTSTNPAVGGQFNAPRGVAVNATGAGGVAPGTIYVADGSNNRVGRFTESGGFVSTWGQDVIQAGAPGDTGTGFEICTIASSCKLGTTGPWGGAFSAVRGVAVNQSTGDVYVTDNNNRVQQFTATGSFVRAWGAGVVNGGATGTGTLANSSTSVTAVATTSKAFAIGQSIAGAGIQAGTTITAVGAGTFTLSKPTTASAAATGVVLTSAEGTGNVAINEQQTVTLGANTTGGTFTLTYTTPNPSNTTGTTTAIPSNASPAGVQTALEALPNVAVGNVAVTGPAGGPWTVEFRGTRFADTDVSQMTTNATGLTVGSGAKSAIVVTTASGASAAETCVAATDCVVGKSLSGAGQFVTSTAVTQLAVAPSGDVYVPDPGNGRVQEFTASGSFVRMWGWDVDSGGALDFEICTVAAQCKTGLAGSGSGQFALGQPTAVAVDSVGVVYAGDGANSRVTKFDSTGHYLSAFTPGGAGTPATTGYNLAVDRSTDRVLVGSTFAAPTERRIEEFNSGGVLQDVHLASGGIADVAGIGVNPNSGYLYASTVTDSARILMIGTVVPPNATIAPATDVAATTATFNGTVTPPGGGMSAKYHFEYSTDGGDWTSFPTADVDVGGPPTPVAVHQQVTGLYPGTHYLVRLVATTVGPVAPADVSSTVDFTTETAPPLIAASEAVDVVQTTAGLRAKIDPYDLATAYHFEWGPTAAYGQRSPSVDPTINGKTAQVVETSIAGLQPNTAYHFRVVATNAAGTSVGGDRTLRTLNAAGLPDGRAYEIVSPPARGAVARPGGGSSSRVQFQAAADGQSIVWPVELGTTDLATRTPDEWASDQLAADEYRYFSPDLSCGVFASGDDLFRHDADGSSTLITDLEPTNAASVAVEDRYSAVSGSADCGHVVFESAYTYPSVDASGLYEWDHGTLRNVGALPDGSVATGAMLGTISGQNAWNAVSENGSRVFFSATSNDGNDAGKAALFVRKDGTSTIKASASKTLVADQGAVYQLASKNGSRVLFLANYGLTDTTSSGPVDGACALSLPLSCDLYAYDVDTGDLTDLSAHTGESAGATVAGVLGASNDASYVYFAARGQLVPGEGRSMASNFSHGSYNVYLAHGGQRSFVGLLRASDVSASAQRNGALISRSTASSSPWASRVTPDGRHLLFPSSANVTGYDSGGVTEAYLYSADADETVCVSCRRDGQPSAGVPVGSEGATVPLASDGSTGRHNPLQPPRTLSADGSRVFFETPDALASGAVSGHDNVYEWNDGQVSLLASGEPADPATRVRFEDASSSGDDVFISTREALLPQDVDGSLDVYAVRVDGGLPWTPPPIVPPEIVVPPPLFQTPLPRAAFSVRGLTSAQRARLVAGKRVSLSIKVNRAGKLAVKGVAKIKGIRTVVLKGSRKAKGATTLAVPIALSKAARTRIAKAGSLKVSLTVSFSGVRKKVVRSVVFKKAR